MQILEGREVGGCRLLRKIGAGGMGEVYLAEQLRMGNRLVAVKLVNPNDHTFNQEVADDLTRRFEREAALLGRLSHPHILPVHDAGVEDGLLYLVMEYVPDGSMSDAIRGSAKHPLALPVSVPFALDLIGQLGDALQYVHDNGVVHRDVKPGNVLVKVQPNGQWDILLADFGVARNLDTASQRTQVTGTFAFMSPEQFSGNFSPASDQYALGVLAFLLLSGRPPFDGDLAALTKAHMYDEPPSLCALNGSIPPAIENVIARALAKDPAQRWPSVAAFVAALRGSASGDADKTRPVPAGAVPATPPRAQGTTAAYPPPAAAKAAPATGAGGGGGGGGRSGGPWRILVTAVAALVLLGSIIGGAAYVQHQQDQVNVHATQTARATATATATTALPGIAQCDAGQTLAVTADAPCIPRPPVAVTQTPLLDSPAPLCDTTGGNWIEDTNTAHTCETGPSLTMMSSSSASLACIESSGLTSADGYASVYVKAGTGSPVLGIRQGQAPAGGTTYTITGYYLKVFPTSGQYAFYKVDGKSATVTTTLKALPGPLASDFVLGVAYRGNQFTFYVNGQPVGSDTDAASTFASGGLGLCVDGGSVSYRYAQVYALAE